VVSSIVEVIGIGPAKAAPSGVSFCIQLINSSTVKWQLERCMLLIAVL